ncbi:unnamed protein product [Ectocarpus sp. CCAP 1310/34]|nr:unnamed protein product [Ectocarpus sp. CCAP 1310/34]
MAAVTAMTTTMVSIESAQDPTAITPFGRRNSGGSSSSSSSSSKEGSSDDGGGRSGRERTADLPVPSAITGPLAARAATTQQRNPVAPLPKWSSLQFWGTNGPGSEGGEGKVGDLAARDGAGDGGMYLGAESTATTGANRTYHCQICLDDRPAEAGFVLSACGHLFCRECLKAYVTSKINDAEVHPACFNVDDGFRAVEGGEKVEGSVGMGREGASGWGRRRGGGDLERARGGGGEGRRRRQQNGQPREEKREGCGAVIIPSDIKDLIKTDKGTQRKYARFLFSREHKAARECPRCANLSVGDPSASLEMRCGACGCVFCYEHGGAHQGKTCAEYVDATADETNRTMALIGRMTKPCPGCQTPVEKLGGCNQMVCMHCHCSFCWICMEHVDRGTFPVHFQWWNVRGCPNQQLQEDSHQSPRGRQCHKLLSAVQIVVVGPLALLLTVASSLACVCCLPAFRLSPRQLFTGCISGWGNFVMVLPLLPVVLVGAVLAAVLYLVMLPARLFRAISRKCSSRTTSLDLTASRRPNNSRDARSGSRKRRGGGGGGGGGGGAGRGDTGQEGEAGGGGGDPNAIESGTIGAAAEAVTETTGSSSAESGATAGASALAILTEVLGPQLFRGGQGDRRDEEEPGNGGHDVGRRRQEEEERMQANYGDEESEEGRRYRRAPHPSALSPHSWMPPPPFHQYSSGSGVGGDVGVGGGVGVGVGGKGDEVLAAPSSSASSSPEILEAGQRRPGAPYTPEVEMVASPSSSWSALGGSSTTAAVTSTAAPDGEGRTDEEGGVNFRDGDASRRSAGEVTVAKASTVAPPVGEEALPKAAAESGRDDGSVGVDGAVLGSRVVAVGDEGAPPVGATVAADVLEIDVAML